MHIVSFGPSLRLEWREDGMPWLTFLPKNGPIGQINLAVMAERTHTSPVTAASIRAFLREHGGDNG